MPNLYNRIQGRNLDRLAALSDGIFAVAMTLLVLDLHIPSSAQVHGDGELLGALAALGPQWIAYGMSFLTLGIFWAGQQTQLNHLAEGTRDLTWIHLGFLFAVTLLPLSTRLLAEFIHYRAALGIYWLNIFVLGAMLYWSWAHATHASLIKADTPAGSAWQHLPPHPDCAVALCRWRRALLHQYLGEHCGHRAGAVELCARAALAVAEKALETALSQTATRNPQQLCAYFRVFSYTAGQRSLPMEVESC